MEFKDKLQDICDTFQNDYNYSGTCLVRKGDATLFSYVGGMAHRGFGIPNRLDTKFNTASISKVFTAAAVLLLVEDGKFGFNDTITKLIDLKGTMIPEEVTIEHLLTHTSGIADDEDEEAGIPYEALFVDKPNYSIRNTVDFLPQFAYKKPLFKAGTMANYNNCAFILLGLTIEKYSGLDYRSFVVEKILRPLGLKNTAFYAHDTINENTAEGYATIRDEEGNCIGCVKNIYMFPPIGTPDGGIYSSVEDLDKFIRCFRGHTLLSSEYSQLMLSPHSEHTWQDLWGNRPPVNIHPGYGFDFIMDGDKIMSMSKDGRYPGAKARLMIYPETDISVAILANSDCNIWEMHRQIEEVLS